jgi:GntR family transcriptional regulator/MocR family aminotransferase
MPDLILSIPGDNRPAYLRIADGVRSAIQTGRLKPGEKLPSGRALARLLGVHRHTVGAAMDELVAEGWLQSGERRLRQVSAVLPSQFFEPQNGKPSLPQNRKHQWRLVRSAETSECGPPDNKRYRYAFQGGQPDLRLFPYDEIRACLSESLRRSPATRSGYANPAGHPYFIERVEAYLTHIRAVSGRKVIVTHGTQEAVFLIAQLLIKPGDKVAVEELGYSAAWDAFRAAGAELVPLRVDSDGVDPDALAEAAAQHRLRLIYLTPHHQYPTTVTLPACRRLRLYDIACRHRIPIFEDDYDHEFHYRCQPIAPLASSDPCELVVYSSTLSKIMFPSLRIGLLAVPDALYEPLLRLRMIVTRQNDVLLQDAVARWIDNGGFERHLRRMRRVYQERRDTTVEALEQAQARGLPVTWTVPDGGMALWMDCATDADAVAKRAAAKSVHVTTESAYRLDHRPGTHLRLGFASQTPNEIRKGMTLLMEAVGTQFRPELISR